MGDCVDEGGTNAEGKRSISPPINDDAIEKRADAELKSTMRFFEHWDENQKTAVKIALRSNIRQKIIFEKKYLSVRDNRRDLTNKVRDLMNKVSQLEEDLREALALTRLQFKLEYWEAMLAPHLLVPLETPITNPEMTSESEKNKPKQKKKNQQSTSLKKVPFEIFDRILNHAKIWYWILTENTDNATVKHFLQLLQKPGEPEITIHEISMRFAGFFSLASKNLYIPKKFRKISVSEVDDIINDLGISDPITIRCVNAIVKLG